MAMMAKMRSLAPWFIISVGGLFVLFMVLSDSKVVEIFGQRSNNVGYINGDDVTYQEFAGLVERARANQVQQTGQDIDENQMDRFRDQIWDALVSQKLIEEKIDEFGITVTDDEIRDVILGPNPPEFLRRSFIDSAGNFNRQLYEEALYDPRNKEALLQAEDAVRQQQYQEKLQSLLNASVVVSEAEIERKFVEQNIKMSADYALIEQSAIPDSTVIPTQDEIENYYNKNLDKFKVDAQRKIKYVLFERKPSAGDTSGIENNLEAIIEKLKEDTASFKTYVEIYSDQPFSVDTLSVTLIPPQAQETLMNAEVGSIVGPLLLSNEFAVYKINDRLTSDEEAVKASHILIRSTPENDAEAKAKADEVYQELRNGADFAEVAKEKSDDPGSGAKGGSLGWFGKGQMVPEFEKASFEGRIGVVQRPIKTNFGYHIIKVENRTSDKLVVERIVNAIEPSATTIDNIFNNASDFAYLADKNSFESEAELLNHTILETPAFKEDAVTIPGLGANKALVKFSFDNGVGTSSEVYKVSRGYVVAQVSEIIKPGFKDLETVESQVKAQVIRDNKFRKAMEMMAEVKSRLGDSGDLNTAPSVNPKVKVNRAENFSAGGNIPSVGNDFTFSEKALDLELNQISDPFRGNKGSYLLKVTSRSNFDSTAYSIQRNMLRDQLLTQKRNQFFSQWIQNLKEEADIVDNRYMFYR
jgi:peptidyl-prolyl cis-trans isomerase D